MSEVIVLYNGYSALKKNNEMSANCTCTLIKGMHNIIVDTMTPWDSSKIITALEKQKIEPRRISYVVSTHGHSDHIGNNNLFLQARHIVGFNISYQDTYFSHPFDKGEEYVINNTVQIVPTPGHTLSDVTVIVASKELETVAITGDLFEKEEDIENPDIWLKAGSESPVLQMQNRSKVANLAHWIVPGHGPKFRVTQEMKDSLSRQAGEANS